MDSVQPSISFLLIVTLWLFLLADQYVSGSPCNTGPTAPASTPTETSHLDVREAQAWLSGGLHSSNCSSSLSLLRYSLYSQHISLATGSGYKDPSTGSPFPGHYSTCSSSLLLLQYSLYSQHISLATSSGYKDPSTGWPFPGHYSTRRFPSCLSGSTNRSPHRVLADSETSYKEDPTTAWTSHYSMHSWSQYSIRPTSTSYPDAPGWVEALDVAQDLARDHGWEALKFGAKVAIFVGGGLATFCAGVCLYWCTCRKRPREH